MVYYDIHTHHLPVHPEDAAIVNSLVPTFDVETGLFRSVGIHPWELTEHNAGQLLDYLKQQLRKKQFVAVGEAGLDKLAVASMELQLTVFKAQVRLSEEYGLPLIIHCVKAMVFRFAVFNFADCCVVVGVILFAVYFLFIEPKLSKKDETASKKGDKNHA